MTLKCKNKKLVGITKKATIEFGDDLVINDIKIPGPGEYEIGGLLVTAPEENVYSLRTENDLHVVFWHAQKNKISATSDELGNIDALILSLGDDPKSVSGVVAVLNELEPAKIILSTPNIKEAFIKEEQIPTETVEGWKVVPVVGENNRHLILLPCSNE